MPDCTQELIELIDARDVLNTAVDYLEIQRVTVASAASAAASAFSTLQAELSSIDTLISDVKTKSETVDEKVDAYNQCMSQ